MVPQKEEDNQLQRSLPPQFALLHDTVAEQERLSENKFQSITIYLKAFFKNISNLLPF